MLNLDDELLVPANLHFEIDTILEGITIVFPNKPVVGDP